MRSPLLIMAFICSWTYAEAEPSDPCLGVVVRVDKHMSSLKEGDMRAFLQAFSDHRCENNVEFSEWGNELIFNAIEQRPYLFFSTLFKLNQKEIVIIKKEFENPINDLIDLSRSKKAVLDAPDISPDIRKRALDFIELGCNRQHNSIKEWEIKNGKKWIWK
jgi:hypothetical protein